MGRWQNRRSLSSPCPTFKTRYHPQILNKPESNPRTGRRNPTTKYREEAASERLGRSEMWMEAVHRKEGAVHGERAEKWALAPGSSHGGR